MVSSWTSFDCNGGRLVTIYWVDGTPPSSYFERNDPRMIGKPKMATRLYAAKYKDGTERLVRAGNPAQVGRHIAQDWEIKPAGAEDVWRLAGAGVVVEDVKTPTEPEAA